MVCSQSMIIFVDKNMQMNRLTEFLKFIYQKSSRLRFPFISYPKPKEGYSPVSVKKMREFNRVRFHGPLKLACYNPFVNLYFNSRGQGVVCCRNQDTVLGTYPKSTINEIWFGEIATKLREHMLNNDLSMGCGYCEHQFETSRFYGLPSMHADFYSSVKLNYPKIIELELSNTCNLQCVMCSGIVSSSIRKCREKLPPLEMPYDDGFVKQLEEYLPHAKEIKFYGGEPFLIDTYYKIWDKLIAIKSIAKLHVVTNGTVLNDKVKNYLRKLNFTITVSFDAMNKDLFESIRVGAEFENVRNHILEYTKLLGGKGLSLSVTPMKTNCREVPAIIDFCNSLNATVNMSFVENPSSMALWTMPSKELKELELFYKSYKFAVAKGVNAEYNFKAFEQFVVQIGKYCTINAEREDDFFQNLKTQDECILLLNEILDTAIRENIIFESDRAEIINVVKEVDDEIKGFKQQMFYGNFAFFLTCKGFESIKSFMEIGFDRHVLKDKFLKFSSMPDIYSKNYKDFF